MTSMPHCFGTREPNLATISDRAGSAEEGVGVGVGVGLDWGVTEAAEVVPGLAEADDVAAGVPLAGGTGADEVPAMGVGLVAQPARMAAVAASRPRRLVVTVGSVGEVRADIEDGADKE
ncbi:MAG TPA: hypothetical protein PKM36_08390 [Propionibacteriaceae bacterium]|nr:hypothetical protein [Propionibacteriaceae bacterium]